MKRQHIASMVIIPASLFVVGITLAAQDRFALKAPNGIAFSEFKDYDKWQVIASAMADDAAGCGSSPEPGCIKSIVGNPAMIRAYQDGFPANGKPVPDGAAMGKIEWQKKHEVSAYGVTVRNVHGGRVHGEGLEAVPGHERMGLRDAQVRRSHRHVEGVRGRAPGLPQDCLPCVPRDRESERLRLHQIPETVSA
jgi:hypothetical protein